MVGEENMTRTMIAAAAALTLMTGFAVAQTTETTTTTTESTSAMPVVPVVPVVPPSVTENSKQRTVDAFGNVTEHSRSVSQGTSMSPFGDTTVTRRTTETTSTVH
jgi:uncharacterized lipoprotein YajG